MSQTRYSSGALAAPEFECANRAPHAMRPLAVPRRTPRPLAAVGALAAGLTLALATAGPAAAAAVPALPASRATFRTARAHVHRLPSADQVMPASHSSERSAALAFAIASLAPSVRYLPYHVALSAQTVALALVAAWRHGAFRHSARRSYVLAEVRATRAAPLTAAMALQSAALRWQARSADLLGYLHHTVAPRAGIVGHALARAWQRAAMRAQAARIAAMRAQAARIAAMRARAARIAAMRAQAARRVTTQAQAAPTVATRVVYGDVVHDAIYQAAQRWGVSYYYLVRLSTCESGLRPDAYNPSGASGLFQFMPSTYAMWAARIGETRSVWDAYANANVAAYMIAQGQAYQWTCASLI
jgi:soluble lytic murein transglycosylase-like protein